MFLDAFIQAQLDSSMPTVWPCPCDGCSRTFATQKSCRQHQTVGHASFGVQRPVFYTRCGRTMLTAKSVPRHEKSCVICMAAKVPGPST